MARWKDKNFGKSVFDPDYDDRFDAEEDHDRWELEQEMKAMAREGN